MYMYSTHMHTHTHSMHTYIDIYTYIYTHKQELSEAIQVGPPLRRGALRCARTPPPSDQTGSGNRELDTDSWVVSNMWDDVNTDLDHTVAEGPGEFNGFNARSAQDEQAETGSNTASALWTCRSGERGGVVLEGEDALRAPGKLVSVALSAHLAPPKSHSGSFTPHVLVTAAWDQMCQVGPDDEAADQTCRTLFTTTRLPLVREEDV